MPRGWGVQRSPCRGGAAPSRRPLGAHTPPSRPSALLSAALTKASLTPSSCLPLTRTLWSPAPPQPRESRGTSLPGPFPSSHLQGPLGLVS